MLFFYRLKSSVQICMFASFSSFLALSPSDMGSATLILNLTSIYYGLAHHFHMILDHIFQSYFRTFLSLFLHSFRLPSLRQLYFRPPRNMFIYVTKLSKLTETILLLMRLKFKRRRIWLFSRITDGGFSDNTK